MNPIHQYYGRFVKQLSDLGIETMTDVSFQKFIADEPYKINNLFMAGLGMGTLFLRMGAVMQMCARLHDGDSSNDASYIKHILDNLRDTLPSDTNWKNIWNESSVPKGKWEISTSHKYNGQNILDRFVSLRNDFVHQKIAVTSEFSLKLREGIDVLRQMSALHLLFEGGEVVFEIDRYFWVQGIQKLELHPFIQTGNHEGLPYLFQGLYGEDKLSAKFINTILGDETEPKVNQPLVDHFVPMQFSLSAGKGQVFEHGERLKYYEQCFVGRDTELYAVKDWVLSTNDGCQVLPIFSEAGMGKGALVSAIIKSLNTELPVLYHFCGSGVQNNLHGILYHLILQGNKMPGAPIWKTDDPRMKLKQERFPSRYIDTIQMFQHILESNYNPPSIFKGKPLVIIIDGLDEAAVANSQFKISDWFKIYNEQGEPSEDWTSPSHVKWIFTYRRMEGKSEGFRLDGPFKLAKLPCVQPLQGLDALAVRSALKPFNVSEDFEDAVIRKGMISSHSTKSD